MQPILIVDLTNSVISEYRVPPHWVRDYIGGASLGARILYEHLKPEIDPLAPDSPLLFLTGPLTGTGGSSVGRFVVCGRSPATGIWAESNCGGFWGPELRKAGYDGIWVKGRADKPVSVSILDDRIEIQDASHLWGLDTVSAQAALQVEASKPNIRTAVIGPAGEALVPMALILVDHGRAAGRTGLGAVMGSKNLKAITVQGTGSVPTHSSDFPALRKSANRALRDDNFTQAMRELGTGSAADYLDYLGEMPKRYFQSGIFEGAYNVSGSTLAETILKGAKACHACLIACGREVLLPGETATQKGPEYETSIGFGPNLGIDSLVFTTRMGERCDRFGVDSISMSSTIGLAFSLYDRGIIQTKDTGGVELKWGDQGAVEALVDQAFKFDGFGSRLLSGAKALGREFGVEDQAIQVNGLEVPYHDPRGASGMALAYATSPRGACHNQSDYFLADLIGSIETEIGMTSYDRHDGAEKVENIVIHQNWRTVFNALVMCYFANVPPKTVRDLVNAATGMEYDLNGLLQVGERAWTLKRLINQKLGLNKENDRLPKALLSPLEDGGAAGYRIPFNRMLNAYYRARNWDPDTGMPARKLLSGLGLSWIQGAGGSGGQP